MASTKYTRRLWVLGFAEGQRGLDAGCGLGQWSFALAGMCNEVWCVDVSQERIDACVRISTRMKKTNVRFVHGVLESLPFKSASFVQSVVLQCPVRDTLREIITGIRAGHAKRRPYIPQYERHRPFFTAHHSTTEPDV